MITFDQCPHCQGKWAIWKPVEYENHFICINCNMIYSPNKDNGTVIGYLSFIGDRHLAWYFEVNGNKFCRYGTEDELRLGTSTDLPWLDYSITPEKLKLYLLFL